MVDDTDPAATGFALQGQFTLELAELVYFCLLYTSPSPRDS